MAKNDQAAKGGPGQAMRTAALQYPEAEEGIACEGTAVEKRTIKARNKAFLFLGPADAMLKLRESLAEAAEFAVKEPGRYRVGAHGWVTVSFGDPESLPVDVLVRWIDESYRLLAPKQLVALLPQPGSPPESVPIAEKVDGPQKTVKKSAKKAKSR